VAGRTDEITEEVKAIARTRAQIGEKAEALECGIRSTVEETKEGIQEVVQYARETAVDFAEENKHTLDPVYQIRKHKWLIGGTVVLFCILGWLDRRHTVSAPSLKDLGAQVQKGLAGPRQDIFNAVMPAVQDEVLQFRDRVRAIATTFLIKMAQQAVRSVAEPLEAALKGQTDTVRAGSASPGSRLGKGDPPTD
jgi:hypothetical protein